MLISLPGFHRASSQLLSQTLAGSTHLKGVHHECCSQAARTTASVFSELPLIEPCKPLQRSSGLRVAAR